MNLLTIRRPFISVDLHRWSEMRHDRTCQQRYADHCDGPHWQRCFSLSLRTGDRWVALVRRVSVDQKRAPLRLRCGWVTTGGNMA